MEGGTSPGTWRARPLPLLVLLVLYVLVPAIMRERALPIASLVLGLLFGVGTYAVATRPVLRGLSLLLLVASLGARVVFFAVAGPGALLAVQLTSALFIVFTAVALMTVVYGRGHGRRERIVAALATYLLFGFVWAYAYSILDLAGLGACHFPEGETTVESPLLRVSEYRFVYFSFVTLTTVGYGDVTPVAPLARALATLEALTGQLFLAVTIASLVGAPSEAQPPAPKAE